MGVPWTFNPTDPPCLLAFGPFGSAWMLLWGAAAVAPILIHLWNRRRYRRTEWAAMQYLLAAVRRRARRMQLEQLLLLAVRVALLLLLAVALAEPLLPSVAGTPPGDSRAGQTHVVLVLDASYTMDYREGDASRFERAQRWAEQRVERSEQGDGFSLVLLADPPRPVVSAVAFDVQDVVAELRALGVDHARGSLPATLAEVERMVQQARQRHPRLSRTRVYFVTDLGRATWESTEQGDVRRRIERLAERAELALVDVGSPQHENLALTRLELRDSLVTAGRPITLEAELVNDSQVPIEQHRVEFFVNGEPVHVASVDVPAGGQASVAMAHQFDASGEYFVEARSGPDPLAVDNRRWLSVPVRESIEVLAVEGRPGAARSLALALNPTADDRASVRATVAAESALVELDLSRFDCLVLANVARFSSDEVQALQQYLAQGGGLVFLLGDQVRAENYNLQLGGELGGPRLLPARLGSVAPESHYSFHPLDYAHPIVAPFRGFERSGLLTTPIWKYFQLLPVPDGQARTVLAFTSGDPAMVEEPRFNGRSILWATDASLASPESAGASWNELAAWPSFVPLVHETLAHAIAGRFDSRNALVGDALEGTVAGAPGHIPLEVVPPGESGELRGDPQRVQMSAQGTNSRWSYDQTRRAGIYEARYGPPLSTSHFYAVNLAPDRARLERYDPALLPNQLTSQETELAAATRTGDPDRSRALFRYVLAGVLALLLADSTLAWYLGNRRS